MPELSAAMPLDEKGRDAAYREASSRCLGRDRDIERDVDAILTAYLSSLTPSPVGELVQEIEDVIPLTFEKHGEGYYDTQTTHVLRRIHASLTSLSAEVARLRMVLVPFNDIAGEMFARGWDASNVALALDNPNDPHRVTAGDFFAVRAALSAPEGGEHV